MMVLEISSTNLLCKCGAASALESLVPHVCPFSFHLAIPWEQPITVLSDKIFSQCKPYCRLKPANQTYSKTKQKQPEEGEGEDK